MSGRPFDTWTRLLAEHFFNPARAGQTVRLNVTRELLTVLARPHGLSAGDFASHAAQGLAAYPKRTDNVCEYAESLLDGWPTTACRADDPTAWYPPFVGYLGVLVFVATLDEDANRSYHRNLWSLFPIRTWTTTPTMYPGFDRMGRLWGAVETWSRESRGGELGVFRPLRLGSFAHVSVPWAQAVMAEEERGRLPGMFAASELTPHSPAPPARLRQIVNEFGSTCLSGRTRRAIAAGGELEGYVLDDLRRELRAWDGTCRSQFQTNGREVTVPPRSADLVLFLVRRGNQLLARLRFESAIEGEARATRYHAGPGRPALLASPAAGWSAIVGSEDGSEFDAAKLDWGRDAAWNGSPASGPRRLKFSGRSVRVFVPATRYGLGGLVEGDHLPASGGCWVSAGASERPEVEGWLRQLPAGAFRAELASLPHGWVFYRIDAVPSDPGLRASFPGGAEDTEPELRLRGGLRVRRGRGMEYHTFAPPRLELGGDRTGITVEAEGLPLVPVDDASGDGVCELPLSVGPGSVRVRALRGGAVVAEASFSLVDVAHAGGPTRIRVLLDGFGRPSSEARGWCGGWVVADDVPRFDFGMLAPPMSRSVAPVNSLPDQGEPPGGMIARGHQTAADADPPPDTDSNRRVAESAAHPEPSNRVATVDKKAIGDQGEVAPAMSPIDLHRSVTERVAALEHLAARIQSGLARHFSSAVDAGDELEGLVREFLTQSAGVKSDVRRVCEAGGLAADWDDQAALVTLLTAARTAIETRLSTEAVAPLRRLAAHLDWGHVGHHLAKARERLNTLRRETAAELRAITGPDVRPLPGPADCQAWLEWFWTAGDTAEQALDEVRDLSPKLAEFLETVTREQWTPLPAADAPKGGLPVPGTDAMTAPPAVPQPAHPEGEIATPAQSVVAPTADPPPNDTGGPVVASTAPDSTSAEPAPAEPATMSAFAGANPTASPNDPPDPHDAAASGAVAAPAGPVREYGPVDPPPVLPPALATFDEFHSTHWVTPQGKCEPAPWLDVEGFGDRLTEALFQAIEAERFGRAKVLAAAARQLECDSAPTPDEVETWARLWLNPRDAVGLGIDGVLQLRLAAGEGRLVPTRVWKLRVCLEAVRPSRDLPPADDEVEEWLDATDFASGSLRQMLLLLLRVGRATDRPTDEVRRALKASGARLDTLTDELATARKDFHAEVRRLWSGAGGKIERSHCRRAWDEFVSQVRATLEPLYPPAEGGREEWDPDDVGRKIARLERCHKDIADEYKAKFHDRQKMDRAARAIAEQSAAVNDLYRKVRAARQGERQRPVSDGELVARSQSLQAEATLADPFEEACRQLIVRLVTHRAGADSRVGLTAADLLEHPALLGCFATDPVQLSKLADADAIPVTDLTHPAAAAAVILDPALHAPRGADGPALVDRLAHTLIRNQRCDVLGPLVPHLNPSDQAKVRAARNAVAADTAEAFACFKRGWERLADLASRDEQALNAVLKYAGERLRAVSADESPSPGSELLFRNWLQLLAAYTHRLFEYELASIRRAVTQAAHPAAAEILRALHEGRLADAVYLRNEAPRDQAAPTTGRRQTAWRKEAAVRFANSDDVLRDYRRRLDPTGRAKGELGELIAAWLDGHSGTLASDQPLRTRFADVVFADTFGGEGEQLRKQGKSERTFFRMPCQRVREYVARQGLNPSFLPQLTRFEEIVLITPPARNQDPGLVQQTANLIAANHASKLVGVLAPGIKPDLRVALLQELRQRKATAAVLDSVDLCRLLNPGGRQINLVIGLLEVMLEQQRWMSISPFHAHDGAQARIEMYVGRADEAEVLATGNKYSRLFSGRKLGKSALLKFIEDTYEGFSLPSGNRLHVLRIPIVGNDADAVIIGKVLAELKNRLGFQPAEPAGLSADAFLAALSEFLVSRPRESLLVILDEADVFIERQLQDFDARKEQCLSFRIRSDAQKEVDGQGLPRIRFVFAGYRKANTRGGAWGNWGDPLLLNPLEGDEAADLIAGPLARLGIDAADAGPAIAYRCGYQPAVLLRFGERLLEVLDAQHPNAADRGHVVVTPAHVREVFDHQAVQDEIRTVVRNNFHGNDAGQAVFSATLLAFATLAPGDALVNAPEEVWRRLRELVDKGSEAVKQAAGRVGWLAPRTPGGTEPTEVAVSEINRHLADFHERKLLTLVNREDGVYRLRFPYHLAALLVEVEVEAWAALAKLAPGPGAGEDDAAGDPVHPLALSDLEVVLRKHQELGLGEYRAGVLGTLWPQSVTNSDWLANRLGYEPGQLSQRGEPRAAAARAYLEVTPAEADGVLAARPADAPPAFMVGGADLLRWGLRFAQSGAAVEVQGQRRLTRAAVDRWFRRVRGFEFDRDELDRITAVTGRIPYLVCLFYQTLKLVMETEGGVNVGQDQFALTAAKYEKKLTDHLDQLTAGPDAVRLTLREQELLLMAVVAARAGDFKQPSLLRDVQEYWAGRLFEEAWARECPGRRYPAEYADTAEDRLAVRVVADLGLLPLPIDQAGPHGLPFLGETDPLVRVIAPVLAKALPRP